jgi:formate dehydrogenase subunit delta
VSAAADGGAAGRTASLVRMANQIGSFFEAMPDRAEALEGIARHLKKFWDPRMRRQLLAHVDAGDETGLSEVVAEAIVRHRDLLA